MQQYKQHLEDILSRGTRKPGARSGLPGSLSLFGYQTRYNLQEGFPIVTTKKIWWKGVYEELLWMLRGVSNIKPLINKGINIWNEDAYNYYKKLHLQFCDEEKYLFTFGEFTSLIGMNDVERNEFYDKTGTGLYAKNYILGDCGYQYPKVWRNWKHATNDGMGNYYNFSDVDQIANLIKGLRMNPKGRRHIVTAIDPAHDEDLALYWCHCLMQFNCRPLNTIQRIEMVEDYNLRMKLYSQNSNSTEMDLEFLNIPKYVLDCSFYQRSADIFLGVPFNISSYALLAHIIAKMCNMIPGELIHSFGDSHIYENHMEQVQLQLSREPFPLPTLEIKGCPKLDWATTTIDEVLKSIEGFEKETFVLNNYQYHPEIKAELSTGLQKERT